MSDEITFTNPPTVAPPLGTYTHVASIPAGTRLLAIAGQVGVAPDGTIPPEPERQYENVLRNIVHILESQGASPAQLVKLNTYLVVPMNLEEIRPIRKALLGDAAPPATMIYVPRLAAPEYLVEIEAWAAVPEPAR
ncbi:MAG TPA: RidA family protein [Allosphingosinicella sp.]|jgi:enamine deaminase RidA (YjgF/YER057c/UK114 family)